MKILENIRSKVSNTLIPTTVTLALGGCILSGTFVITFFLEFPHRFSGSAFEAVTVDLNEEEDWADHSDQIDRIESVKIDGEVTNNTPVADTFDIYLSFELYSTLAEFQTALSGPTPPQSQTPPARAVVPLALGVPLPANATTTYTAAQTALYLQLGGANFQSLRSVIMESNFYLYLIGANSNFDMTLEQGTIYITFTASN